MQSTAFRRRKTCDSQTSQNIRNTFFLCETELFTRIPKTNRHSAVFQNNFPQLRKSELKIEKKNIEDPKHNVCNYLDMIKGKVFLSKSDSNSKSEFEKQMRTWRLNKKTGILKSMNNNKIGAPPFILTSGIESAIDKLMDTYQFIRQVKISSERLVKLIKISSNNDPNTYKLFLNDSKSQTKKVPVNNYQVVFQKTVIIQKLENLVPSLKKAPEEIEVMINLFRSKLECLVHEIDNSSIKDLQRSIVKYNNLVGYMKPQLLAKIDKDKYYNKKNILTQVVNNQKIYGDCHRISKISRNRYEVLDVAISKIRSDPLW